MLRGTQYSTKIKQFFEFDMAIKKLEEGFGKLLCSYPDCDSQAVTAFEGKMGNQLYNIASTTLIILITQQSLRRILNLS